MRNLPIIDLGNVFRLDSCQKQKNMCWGYDGFVLAHKDINPEFDEEKPFIIVIDQDGVRQMHFENFGKFPKNEKILDDMYKAVSASCEKGMELQLMGGATPGGLSGFSKLQNYGFKKVFMPDDTNVYWGGELDQAKLEKWLNSGRHDDDFIVRTDGDVQPGVKGGVFVSPSEYRGQITAGNTKPRPFKMVRESRVSEAVSVGGKNPKYGKAVLTRPGESPDMFNGEDLRKIRDNYGRVGNVKCKFYTDGDPNSEYIMTNTGSVRRIKGDQGKGDDGLHGWCDMALFHEEVTDGKLNSMVQFFLRFNRKRGESERLHFSIDLKGGSAYLWVQDNANGGRWTCVPEKMFEKQGVLMKCLMAREPLPDIGVAPIQSGFVTEPKVGLEILELSFDFSEDHGHRLLTTFHNGHAVCHIEKQKLVRESDRQILYWAHMLDECGGM